MSHIEGKLTLGKYGVIRAGEFRQYTNGKAQSQFAMVSCPDELQEEEGVTQEENARRLVACWNATIGIPTEMLEAMPSGPASLLPMYDRLEKERDGLLKALRDLHLNGFSASRSEAIDAILARYPEGKS